MPRVRGAIVLLTVLLGAVALACGDGSALEDDGAASSIDEAPTKEAAFALNTAPSLDEGSDEGETQTVVLTSLVDDATVNERVLEVRGIVEPGSAVTVGDSVATVGPHGHFAVTVKLAPGENLRTFAVTSGDGSAVLHSMVVNYEPTPMPIVQTSTLAASATKVKDATKELRLRIRNHRRRRVRQVVVDGVLPGRTRGQPLRGRC